MKTREKWLPVAEYKGVYEVSSRGRVRRILPCQGTRPGRILRPHKGGRGYLFVSLHRDGVKASRNLGHLVATAFCERSKHSLSVVRYRDGDRTHNTANNLYWGTRPPRPGVARGIRSGAAKLNDRQVRRMRKLYAMGRTQVELASLFGIVQSTVSKVLRGQTWSHVGSPKGCI